MDKSISASRSALFSIKSIVLTMNGTDATLLIILSLRLDDIAQNSRRVEISSNADWVRVSRMKDSILKEYITLTGRVTYQKYTSYL